jgi:hypothetical protein
MKTLVAFVAFGAFLLASQAVEDGVAMLAPSQRQLRRVLFDCETSHNYVY